MRFWFPHSTLVSARMVRFVAGSSVLAAMVSCVDVPIDENESTTVARIEFDPANSVIPFPNNLVRNPANGLVALPASCNESASSKALREGVLNTLDGFGTFKGAMQVTFSAPIDAASLQASVRLYQRTAGATPNDPTTAKPIPVVVVPTQTLRYSKDCASSSTVEAAAIVPMVPLSQKSTYVVGILKGVKAQTGADVLPSSTFSLVRSATNPVTVENGQVVSENTPLNPGIPGDYVSLLGLDTLWKAHAQGLAFLDKATGTPRSDMLLAWEFSTGTITDTLDSSVTGSVAATVTAPALGTVTTVATEETLVPHMEAVLGAGVCALLRCTDNVGSVLGAALTSPNYQSPSPNPLAGGATIPGPWSSATTPQKLGDAQLNVVAFVPKAAAPSGGYPTIVFAHGLGGQKENLYPIASQLNGLGFAVVAINAVSHGDRAVRISDNEAAGCAGTPKPSTHSQCFAPFLSPNLAATRDNLRQSVVDLLALGKALKACGTTACGELKVNGAKLGYFGFSLGGVLGSIVHGVSSDFKAAVLSVPGVGFMDIIEGTQEKLLSCRLVNSLIDAGVLTGEKSNADNTTGLCTTDAWKAQPAYRSFANIARWVFDPADGVNYTRKLAAKRFMMQEVTGDMVIPNATTGVLGQLVGLMPTDAAMAAASTPAASAPLGTNPAQNLWMRYSTQPAAGAFPGNTYTHYSLLKAEPDTASRLATAQMQADALTYLVANVK